MQKRFWVGMVIYGLVFLVIAGAGLFVFWNFIDAYEQSRPLNTVKAYVASVTAEDMWKGSGELLAGLDGNIQSEEEACAVISESVTLPLSYAKKSGESSENRQVYVLRSGKQVIGEFAITAGEPDKFGFRVWSVTEESFDFSHLLSDSISMTVPADYTVSINGNVLNEAYITETDIPFAALEEFYDDYTLPAMVTYTAEGFLGELTMEAADQNGTPVEVTPDMDWNAALPGCDVNMTDKITGFTEDFLYYYVTFTSSANGMVSYNYMQLQKHLVPNGELSKRLYTAIDGLQFAQSWGDTIQDIEINRMVDLGEDRYMCDATYIVETYGKKGRVETENNVKLIIVDMTVGLRVEAMTRY